MIARHILWEQKPVMLYDRNTTAVLPQGVDDFVSLRRSPVEPLVEPLKAMYLELCVADFVYNLGQHQHSGMDDAAPEVP
jgi:hypothetical protein